MRFSESATHALLLSSLCNVEQWLINLILVTIFPTLLKAIKIFACFWLFSGIALVCLALLWLILKETKGQEMSQDQI